MMKHERGKTIYIALLVGKEVGTEPIMSGERTGVKWAYVDTPAIIVEIAEPGPEGKAA